MNILDEAELKTSTKKMYEEGGISNVLDCLITMLSCQLIILRKLKELIK